MKSFEEWWENSHPHSTRILACKEAYEAGQANALPELTTQEWKQIKYYHDYWGREHINKYPGIVRLMNQALELRERQKKL